MSIMYLLIPLALVLAGLAVVAFVWSARQGQLDDLVTPALRMLHDDDDHHTPERRRPDSKTGPARLPDSRPPDRRLE